VYSAPAIDGLSDEARLRGTAVKLAAAGTAKKPLRAWSSI